MGTIFVTLPSIKNVTLRIYYIQQLLIMVCDGSSHQMGDPDGHLIF